MTTKTFVCCDRCGATVEPAARSTISHTKLQVTTYDREYINAPKDLCERCTQSLKIWMQGLPNREVKYLEADHPILEDGSFGDVMARLRDGACAAHFFRKAWLKEDGKGGYLGFTESAKDIHIVRILSGDGRSDDLTAEDILAKDWVEFRWVDDAIKDEPKADGEGAEEDE